MTNTEWKNVIETSRSALIDEIKDAYRRQCTTNPINGYTERIVLFDNGSIHTMQAIGNTYYAAEHDGNALCIASIKGQKPDEWEDWIAEYGNEEDAAKAMLDMALTEWDWNPESYINETLIDLMYSE